MQALEDRAFGALLGTALGDAFGSPFEGADPDALHDEMLSRASRRRPWRYTHAWVPVEDRWVLIVADGAQGQQGGILEAIDRAIHKSRCGGLTTAALIVRLCFRLLVDGSRVLRN